MHPLISTSYLARILALIMIPLTSLNKNSCGGTQELEFTCIIPPSFSSAIEARPTLPRARITSRPIAHRRHLSRIRTRVTSLESASGHVRAMHFLAQVRVQVQPRAGFSSIRRTRAASLRSSEFVPDDRARSRDFSRILQSLTHRLLVAREYDARVRD